MEAKSAWNAPGSRIEIHYDEQKYLYILKKMLDK
jgi:hypothetical protein